LRQIRRQRSINLLTDFQFPRESLIRRLQALVPRYELLAEVRGRRLILIIGLCALPARGVLFALLATPALMVAVQALDGLAGASFGVLVPLIASDVAGRSGHYNLSLGFLGVAIGIGATLSTIVAGWIADRFGDPAAFIGLGVVGLAAVGHGP